ncbi:hypothetical protein EV128_125153 [Rhizobium azibense]|nr:hypothetical protein EV128_125153 [Rhizobium azibense]
MSDLITTPKAADPKPEAKKALEAAIQKIGKSYGDLLRVAEKHGDDISKDDYAKAQYFLSETIKKIWEKIDVVRDVAKATNGDFSLDSIEMPAKYQVTWYNQSPRKGLAPEERITFPGSEQIEARAPVLPAGPIDTSKMDGKTLAKAIGGRLTKAAAAVAPRPVQSINTDLDEDGLPPADTGSDLLDDVDFIDDK